MKIAFVSTGCYPRHSGGASISTRVIVDELRKLGHHIDIYTITGSKKIVKRIDDNHYEIPDGTKYKFPQRIGKNYSILKHIANWSDYDLIHAYGFEVLPGLVLATRDTPVLGTANTLVWVCINWTEYLRSGCPEYSLSEEIRLAQDAGIGKLLPLKIGQETLGRYLAKKADHYTAQTTGMKMILERCGYNANRITTVPNILDPRFRVKSNTDVKHLVYIGRLIDRKGVKDIVRSYTQLPSEIRDDWEFSIYGNGPLKPTLINITKSSDVDINFEYCSYEELPGVYKNASVMIHGTKYPEPFSRTWLEAMASDTAIVCSENPSSKAVLNGIAEFYDPFNRRDLIETLSEVLTNTSKRYKMALRGKKELEQYEPKRVAERYNDLYQKLIK